MLMTYLTKQDIVLLITMQHVAVDDNSSLRAFNWIRAGRSSEVERSLMVAAAGFLSHYQNGP